MEVCNLMQDRLVLKQHLTRVLLNQMLSKVGMNTYGYKYIQVLHDEFLQLHNLGVLKPIQTTNLTRHQTKDSLHAMPVVKEKHYLSLKGSTCANDIKQRGWCTKPETASPAAHNESLMMDAST